ncbi:unnamed protein product [marine sediment metagenome]|uniref:Uncharacterized protein n=1 Tax=marine sediment metagenome TaxID=412755 RepID=X1RVA5_9ZZZZ
MNVTKVQVGNVIYPLIAGQSLPVAAGDTIRVFYAFKYKLPETTGVRIWASLYYYTLLGIFEREEKAQTKGTITLEKALEWTDYSGEIDIIIGEATSDIYGLILELPEQDAEDKIEACIEVKKAAGIMEMIGPLLPLVLMVLVVSMMAPMMKGE